MARTVTKTGNGRSLFSHSLAAYLASLSQHAPIPAEQERVLAARYRRSGDPEAAKTLILSNLRFVVKVALQYRTYGCDLNELVQEGNLGLAEALERFDPERGARLITYASYWIRERIRRRIARGRSVSARGTTRAERKLSGDDPRNPRPQRDVPLDRVDPARLTSDRCPEKELIEKERAVRLRAAVARELEKLDPRERRIARARFMSERPPSLAALGQQFGISRERARQLADRAGRKLRLRLMKAGFSAA